MPRGFSMLYTIYHMTLFIEMLYWSTLLIWSGIVTYVIVFVLFPEKAHHDEPLHDASAAPSFARHRFQQLPGNAELTVSDIVTALQHLPKKDASGTEVTTPEEPHAEALEETLVEEVPTEESAH